MFDDVPVREDRELEPITGAQKEVADRPLEPFLRPAGIRIILAGGRVSWQI
jgi:hypothetical protein